MATLLQLQNEISQLEGQRLKSKRAEAKLRQLLQKKKQVQSSVERALRATGTISRRDIGDKIKGEIEGKINREQFMERIIRARFRLQASRATGSPRWARLARSTVKDRISQGFPGARPILLRTGALFSGAMAAVRGTFSLSKGIRWDVNEIDVEYARYHQTGTGRMPARRFFDAPNARELEPTMKRVRQLIRQKLKEIVRSA